MRVRVVLTLMMILILLKMSKHDDFIFWDEMWNLSGGTPSEIIETKEWEESIIEEDTEDDEK